jgi:hypothetical protein
LNAKSACALALLLFATVLWAQNPSGALRGWVQDYTGVRITSATIAFHLKGSSLTSTVFCDRRGEFRIDDLSAGTYVVKVSARGFEDAIADLDIAVSSIRDVIVTLILPVMPQTISVRAQSSSITTQSIDLASQVHQSVITSQDLESLPLASRTFANVAYLAAGTEPVEPSDPTKARITAVSTAGSSGLNNEISVDGADNSDDYIGGFLENFSPDAIQEFSMRTAQEDADTGGTTAGSLVMTTKRGSNNWHGSAAFYDRDAALNVRYPIENPMPNPKQPFSRQNYVGTLGGPANRDRLWFFASFEHVHENASITYSPANTTQFNALATLASEGLVPGVGSIAVPAVVRVPFREYFGSFRLDWGQSAKSVWFLRNSVDNYTTHNGLVEQGALPSTGLLTHNSYVNMVISNQCTFSPSWLGRLILGAGGLRLRQTRNSHFGFALAFPFSSTALTVSGFETFGDNQFATPITFFPSARNQEKYQLRYDMIHAQTRHAVNFGVNFIHEPVLSGAFPGNPEILYQFPQNPSYYLSNPSQFTTDMTAGASTSSPAGSFTQNVQRLSLYAEDSWRVTQNLTVNSGLRYGTTFGLFIASGRSQLKNPGLLTLETLKTSLLSGSPHDDHDQIAPRLGVAYSLGRTRTNVIRFGFGMYYNDLAQTGWVTAFQAVNKPPAACIDPVQNPGGSENTGCVSGGSTGGRGSLIDPKYKTPYALHITGGVQHLIGGSWAVSVDYTHEQGNHGYRAYSYKGGTNLFTPLLPIPDPAQSNVVPDINVFHSDNRSSYNALMLHLQGNVTHRLNLIANYTLARAQTWGCVLGELFDYVNGVCDPLNPFGPGDYGPSGEDVRHRAVLAGTWSAPGGIKFSTLTQTESARPYTITKTNNAGRIAINGVPTALDQFRGTPYIQADARVSRPIVLGERWSLEPFVEIFNLLNRNNPGANYVTNIASLPVPGAQAQAGNITDICASADCSDPHPIRTLNQLRIPGGAFGDFFGPGTTVGAPFTAQLGIRLTF